MTERAPRASTKNRVRQARKTATDTAAMDRPIPYVLTLNPFRVEYLRRIVARELRDDIAKLAGFRPKPDQSSADFADVYRNKERKIVFLQDVLAAIEAAAPLDTLPALEEQPR